MSDAITLDTVKTAEQAKRQVKYHLFFVIMILIFGLFVFALSRFGSNALPFGMFVVFFLLPVFIVFSDNLTGIIPSVLVNVLTKEVPQQTDTDPHKFFTTEGRLSKKNKQYILLFTIVISIILVLYFISKIYPSVKPDGKIGVKKNTEYHLIGSILLLIMMFVMTMNFYEISENAQTQQ